LGCGVGDQPGKVGEAEEQRWRCSLRFRN
jgi:hypothetical protein